MGVDGEFFRYMISYVLVSYIPNLTISGFLLSTGFVLLTISLVLHLLSHVSFGFCFLWVLSFCFT